MGTVNTVTLFLLTESSLCFISIHFRWLDVSVSNLTCTRYWVVYLQVIQEAVWPGGALPTALVFERSQQQKDDTKQQALRCLMRLVPGTSHARYGAILESASFLLQYLLLFSQFELFLHLNLFSVSRSGLRCVGLREVQTQLADCSGLFSGPPHQQVNIPTL